MECDPAQLSLGGLAWRLDVGLWLAIGARQTDVRGVLAMTKYAFRCGSTGSIHGDVYMHFR